MIVIVHGGAAVVDSKYIDYKLKGIKFAVKSGFDALVCGKSAVDAVELAVNCMENDPAFNAGYGSSLTITGEVENDAIVMDGKTLKCGAIGGVSRVQNPVSLARAVMDSTDHCFLISSGAEQFAQEVGIPLVPKESLVHEWAQERLDKYKTFINTITEDKPKDVVKPINPKINDEEHDTVGAVAIDGFGNVAAATSTGGITAKRVGRIGDTPIIGAGGYADNTCGAVSTTGHGEAIMKVCLSREIMYQFSSGKSLQESVETSLELMRTRVDGFGGAIAVGNDGQIGIGFSTQMMPWAYVNSSDNQSLIHYGINRDQHLIDKI